METLITTAIFISVLYLIYRLGKIKYVVEESIDNPYYNNMDNYEKELNKIFDYDNIKVTPFYEEAESNSIIGKNIEDKPSEDEIFYGEYLKEK